MLQSAGLEVPQVCVVAAAVLATARFVSARAAASNLMSLFLGLLTSAGRHLLPLPCFILPRTPMRWTPSWSPVVAVEATIIFFRTELWRPAVLFGRYGLSYRSVVLL